jgi:ectoine hydroxylase-related dioxygenase (phytanoyl-CoA dioxygenase family)
MSEVAALREKLFDDGYAVLPSDVPSSLLDRLVSEVRDHVLKSTAHYNVIEQAMYGSRIRRGYDLAGKSAALLEVLELPWVDAAIEAVLRSNCEHALLSSATALEVDFEPGAVPQPLHRDEDVYPHLLPRLDGGPEYLFNVMIAGTDFTRENGGTLIIPGSHRWPRDRWPRPEDEVISLELARGECGVWLGSTYHGAGVNLTGEPRLGISLAFCLGWLRTIENQYLLFDRETVARLPEPVQRLLGYDSHMALGLHNWTSPLESLPT